MRATALSAALILVSTAMALSDDVPFAALPPKGEQEISNLVSLGDIMSVTQLRHIKLWYAGNSKNWDLVNYQLDRISESLRRAAVLYVNIPVDEVNAAAEHVTALRQAAAAKDSGKFVRAYSALTMACNSCHSHGGVGFIKIQTPTSSPFSDENYGK
ncbi:hypothetical protein AB4Z10_12950 [Bosea sp. RAF48]|uniref:hypothetical protein n=1 Tax=Bosea sp. RAF48 TaxID=3237480 RepID=UPI003F9335B0